MTGLILSMQSSDKNCFYKLFYYRKIYYVKSKPKSIDISGFQNCLSVKNSDAPIRPFCVFAPYFMQKVLSIAL